MYLRKLASIFILFVLSLPIGYAQAKTLRGTVVGITDGDTITVLKGKNSYKIRLEGIDCPEKAQPFWKAAKQFTTQRVAGKKITVEVKGKDRYDRVLGSVILPGGANLSEELLAHGLAWHFVRYSKDTHLQTLEDSARKAKIGIWSLPSSQAPWQYRRALKQNKKEKL